MNLSFVVIYMQSNQKQLQWKDTISNKRSK